MTLFAVTAVGRDRPGIVAAIAERLLAVGGNVEDSRMTILRGHFAVMLIVAVPEASEREPLERGIDEVRERLGLDAVSVSPVDDLPGGGGPEPTHVISVYGADHPGIVHAVSSALAERGIDITDLQTQLGEGATPIYVMMLEAALGSADEAELVAALERVGAEAAVEISIRPLEVEAL